MRVFATTTRQIQQCVRWLKQQKVRFGGHGEHRRLLDSGAGNHGEQCLGGTTGGHATAVASTGAEDGRERLPMAADAA
jgi:hypothetical protein